MSFPSQDGFTSRKKSQSLELRRKSTRRNHTRGLFKTNGNFPERKRITTGGFPGSVPVPVARPRQRASAGRRNKPAGHSSPAPRLFSTWLQTKRRRIEEEQNHPRKPHALPLPPTPRTARQEEESDARRSPLNAQRGTQRREAKGDGGGAMRRSPLLRWNPLCVTAVDVAAVRG